MSEHTQAHELDFDPPETVGELLAILLQCDPAGRIEINVGTSTMEFTAEVTAINVHKDGTVTLCTLS